jgi:hypothetical protein
MCATKEKGYKNSSWETKKQTRFIKSQPSNERYRRLVTKDTDG